MKGIIYTTFRRGDAEKVAKQAMKEFAVTAEVVPHETGGFAVSCKPIKKPKKSKL